MTTNAAFAAHPGTRILTPGAPGLAPLLACLTGGRTIIESQAGSLPICGRDDGGPWLICETSGTGGQAKQIRRTPASWIESFTINARDLALSCADTYATFGSLGHSLTLFATLEALHLGADLCSLGALSPPRQLAAMARDKVTVIYGTPTQLGLLVRAARGARFDTLRRVFVGGGALGSDARRAIAALFPLADIREFYGTSEASFITMSDAQTPPGSVGRAYPGVTIRVGDGTPGQTGEIRVASPYLFDGYVGTPDRGALWRNGMLGTGEIGHLDADGHLFLRGRQSRMVTISDINVFPEDIERIVAAMPGVQSCAVLTLPDAKRGHRAVCVIVPAGPGVDAAAVRRLCHARLGAHCVPRAVHLIDDMPLLGAGKPDLAALGARFGAP